MAGRRDGLPLHPGYGKGYSAWCLPAGSSPENAPLPGQEGMPRHETFLYHLEEQELHWQVTLIVPEGMDETRRVNFMYEEQEMTVSIPEGYTVGQQVTVQVPTRKRPPLERNATQAMHRGKQHLPDRNLVGTPSEFRRFAKFEASTRWTDLEK